MVAPVVLLTTGGILSNGLLTIYNAIGSSMRQMTRERLEIRRGPGGQILDTASISEIDQERLREIGVQLPLLLRRHKLTRLSLLVIYVGIGVLGLSIIVIGIAVVLGSELTGRIALGLVLAGTVILLAGLGVAGTSLGKSGEAVSYAVERTHRFGLAQAS